MFYGIVRFGAKTKIAGSTVWLDDQTAKAHLKKLQALKPKHWGEFEVVGVEAEVGDIVPHDMYPYNAHMRVLTKECLVTRVLKTLEASTIWRGKFYG